jgi:superfamily I DNA/RNA helicase
VSISTVHLAKGLEFRAVVVMDCDDEIIPLQERIETVGDNADLQEVYETRHVSTTLRQPVFEFKLGFPAFGLAG